MESRERFGKSRLYEVCAFLELVELEHVNVTCPLVGTVDPAEGDSLVTVAVSLVQVPSETPVSPWFWSWLLASAKVSPVTDGTVGGMPLET
jgi:hypothetical protein